MFCDTDAKDWPIWRPRGGQQTDRGIERWTTRLWLPGRMWWRISGRGNVSDVSLADLSILIHDQGHERSPPLPALCYLGWEFRLGG